MSDVFVSYARSSEPHAARITEVLRAQGYEVWRDDEIPAHRAYADVIEERIKGAKAVVVVWSAEAAKSQWVRAEADAARQAGTLVQASVDGTLPPMPFNQIQCADLSDWNGDESDPGWRKLADSVAALVRGQAPASDRQEGGTHRQKTSICVLPFVNMSGDAEQEYFSDGISEDIITDLSKVSALAVVARHTAFTFKGSQIDVAKVARQLGVTHVLEGSVRKSGDRVRITAQLIDGATGDHLWAERYDRDLTDIFAIQDEISKAIVAALKLKLLPEEKKAIEQRGTTSAEAYSLYLMARKDWITGNYGDVRRDERVARICQRAVEIDPRYAQAWALMALAQANLRGLGRGGDGGLASAQRALSIDHDIAEAHCVLARRLSEEGRNEEADAEIATALRLDADSWEVNREAGRLRTLQRRIPEAIDHYEKEVSVAESDFYGWGMLTQSYTAQGDVEAMRRAAEMSVTQAERALAQDPSNGAALSVGAAGLAALGEAERAREWMRRGLLVDPDNLTMRYNFACVLALHLNDTEEALAALRPALEKGGGMIVRLAAADRDLDSLRDDPRFQKMLTEAKKRLGAEDVVPSAAETGKSAPATPAAAT